MGFSCGLGLSVEGITVSEVCVCMCRGLRCVWVFFESFETQQYQLSLLSLCLSRSLAASLSVSLSVPICVCTRTYASSLSLCLSLLRFVSCT